MSRRTGNVVIGAEFPGFIVLSDYFVKTPPGNKYPLSFVKCRCLYCGNICDVRPSQLRGGRKESCGCNNSNLTSQNKRKYYVNTDYFNNWSHSMSYILGFLTADGNISSSTRSLRSAIVQDDVEINEFIKKELEYEGPLYITKKKNGRDQSVLNIGSYKIIESLKQHNIIPNKTGKEVLPDIPDEFFYDYLRGFFDGDGCVYIRKNKDKNKKSCYNSNIACASYQFLNSIVIKCGNLGSISIKKNVNCNIWTLGHYNSVIIRDKMYASGGFALKRKKDKFYSLD